jgi:hypothetical protein
MSDSYDDYETKIQLAEQAWEKRVVKTEHDRAVELGQAYERGWNAALAQREWVGLTDDERHGIREWQRIQEELGPVWAPMMLYLYEAIEAKLKEKNHG